MVSVSQAKHFIHSKGTLWERCLWDHLFDDGPIDRVYQSLLCYKNPDGGFGHGLEQDIKCPDSNPLQLDFLFNILRDTNLEPGPLLDGTAAWVEKQLDEDGGLINPNELTAYPHAPWHGDGHKNSVAIIGCLAKYNLATPTLLDAGARYAAKHYPLFEIEKQDWLFMNYNAMHYYDHASSLDDVQIYRKSVYQSINRCALSHEAKGEHKKLFPLFQLVPDPNSPVIPFLETGLIDRVLDYLCETQREDGGWNEEHGLTNWEPYFSLVILHALKKFNRI